MCLFVTDATPLMKPDSSIIYPEMRSSGQVLHRYLNPTHTIIYPEMRSSGQVLHR
jgi:hypothetical protein